EYLRQTVIANPHVQIIYRSPDGQEEIFRRTSDSLPPPTREIKPHPYGIELGFLQAMLRDTKARTLAGFLQSEFSRVSNRVAEEICQQAGLRPELPPHRLSRDDVEKLMAGIAKTKIMTPPTDCVAPIGEEQLLKGLQAVVPADFYAATTRPPAVYRGNPFIIEAAVAWGCAANGNGAEGGGDAPGNSPAETTGGETPARLLRFANRVPLLYQQGACCAYQAAVEVNWRNYSLSQPRGGLPLGPLTLVVHMASVWVPFTSESKEAIAEYPEIMEEMMRALQECGRKLKLFLSQRRREIEAHRKRSYIEMYIPHIGIGLRDLLGLGEKDEKMVVVKLTEMLERARD
ncbi:MAG: DNA topoisomerase VI subunit B, partial [Planctomycetota bacterium]|nr:DNA topoisomerase VI subunit B [Planctomycetota bacterium]